MSFIEETALLCSSLHVLVSVCVRTPVHYVYVVYSCMCAAPIVFVWCTCVCLNIDACPLLVCDKHLSVCGCGHVHYFAVM